jgi:hypothetical protein
MEVMHFRFQEREHSLAALEGWAAILQRIHFQIRLSLPVQTDHFSGRIMPLRNWALLTYSCTAMLQIPSLNATPPTPKPSVSTTPTQVLRASKPCKSRTSPQQVFVSDTRLVLLEVLVVLLDNWILDDGMLLVRGQAY